MQVLIFTETRYTEVVLDSVTITNGRVTAGQAGSMSDFDRLHYDLLSLAEQAGLASLSHDLKGTSFQTAARPGIVFFLLDSGTVTVTIPPGYAYGEVNLEPAAKVKDLISRISAITDKTINE